VNVDEGGWLLIGNPTMKRRNKRSSVGIEMNTIVFVMKSQPVQERLNNFKDKLWTKEQQKQAELAANYQAS
jgi:hypothetical protein